MVPTQIGYCPITGQLIMDLKILSTYFEYSINFNQINYKLRWSINEKGDPAQYIKPNEKIVLQSMLNNNEWPLEEETIISEEFISQLIRLAEYPRDFKEKLNYYLLKCYLNGGREYKKFQFDVKKRLEAYAEDEDEFNRIIKGLNSKKLVNLINTNDFTLSEAGIQLSEQLNQLKIDNEPVWSAGMHKPRITVIGVKEDKFYIDKFQKLFGKYGISVISYDGIDDNNGYATVSNIKNGLYSNETDYVVFIKSESSDRSSSFGSLLDIAIEAHENTDKKNHKYIFVAFVDGSTTKTRPRIDNYHSNFYDFRITTNRKRLALAIRQDWQMRINASEKIVISEELVREFKFPPIDLKEGEEYWLKLLYQNFISGTQPHFSNFISLHWKFLPKGFDPYKINRLLAESGSNITIYGIWAIDPKSKYLQGVEDLIFAIKDILEERGNAEEITSEILLPRLNHPVVDIIRCLRLLSGLGGFLDWYGGKDDGTGIKIKIKDEIQLNKYNDFKSLEETFQENHKDQFKKNNSSDTDNSKKNVDELLNSKMDLKNIHSHKTKFILRDANNIKPVMGVLELSADLAEVIHTLPIDKEKGQMIGVFGKWGRGKTFLLKEIWNFLEKKEDTKYIKIEYHAWKYQETPASWAYLYENFVSEYLGAKKNLCYLYRLSRLNFKRLGFFPIVKFLLVIITSIVVPSIIHFYIQKSLDWYKMIGVYSAFFAISIGILNKIYKEFRVRATDLIKKYSLKNSFRENLGIQADIQEELITLLKVWIPEKDLGKKKIILFVEDIDRCTEDRIIQNVDALRIMLEDVEISKRVIIITAIDERILKNAIKIKYDSVLNNNINSSKNMSELSDDITINELISEYLDKLFISAIKLGGLTSDQRDEYLNELFDQEVDKDLLKEYQENKKAEEIKENYKSSGVSKEIRDALLKEPSYLKMQESFRVREELLSQAGKGNLDLAIKDGDFVIHDGDFGLEDDKGNITSMPEIESTVNERIKNQNKFEKLSPIEVDLIGQAVRKWNSSTPRRVRIFYYRYLLCKNLLINKHGTLKRVNVWQNREGISAMINLILKYTKAHDPNLISEEKTRILELKEQKITILVNDESIVLYHLDYLSLLEVLELVIAY